MISLDFNQTARKTVKNTTNVLFFNIENRHSVK